MNTREEGGSRTAENKPSVARRTIKFVDRTIDRVLTVLFLIVLFIGSYFTYDSWYVFNASALDKLPGYTWEGPETLDEMPDAAICWLVVDDTSIDCPVVQGKTNTEYLNKNPYGEYSLAGSIFLDAGNQDDFSDNYSLLYGHHMSGGYMFGALDDFKVEKFFDAHRQGTITLRDKREIKVNLFAVVETDASFGLVFDVNQSKESNEELLGYIKENAEIYREPQKGRIIGLSTCKSPLSTERLVIFGILTD